MNSLTILLKSRTHCLACVLATAVFSAPVVAADAPLMGSAKPAGPVSGGVSASAGVDGSTPGSLLNVSASAGEPAAANVGPGGIARVGDVEVKIEDVRAMIAGLDPKEREAMASNPALLKRVVFAMIVQRIVMKEADSKQWDQQPEVKARVEQVRQTTIADMYLRAMSAPPADFPSTEELKNAYEAHKDIFVVPHQFQVSQIFIALPAASDKAAAEKTKAKLENVLKKLDEPNADFAAIAHTYSDDTQAVDKGGSMGWITDTAMPPRILAQARVLAKNKISEPIRLDDGWHIIKIADVKDPSPLSFNEVKERLAQQLRAERTQANMQAFVDQLLKQNPVILDDKALPQVLGKAEQ